MESTAQHADRVGELALRAFVPVSGRRECIEGMDGARAREAGVGDLDAVVAVDDMLRDIAKFIISDEVESCVYTGVAALFSADLIGSHAVLVWD